MRQYIGVTVCDGVPGKVREVDCEYGVPPRCVGVIMRTSVNIRPGGGLDIRRNAGIDNLDLVEFGEFIAVYGPDGRSSFREAREEETAAMDPRRFAGAE